ncbi:hypothetical protein GCM10025870_17110 [Agromyces marinus]|uniref:Uncharacterized protein n=1 Tax=Agromyces marinus TaxID=1389020 RepID=A0ABM8H1K9_9MICO|nr:hypothetical protein GCM10025870_17110 [Agromyces marinus]
MPQAVDVDPVEPDDAEFAGHGDPEFVRGAEDARGEQVALRDDRGRSGRGIRQQRQPGFEPLFDQAPPATRTRMSG